jgi:hypothetical protein
MMTKALAPQEDHFKLPASWTAKVLPRRGSSVKKRVKLADPTIVEELARERADKAEDLRVALDLGANGPFATVGKSYLDGQADPCGAGVIASLLLDKHERYVKSWLRPTFDAWVHEHGLAFAVAASVEFLAVSEQTEWYHETPPLQRRVLVECPTDEPRPVAHEMEYGGIAAARSLLAAASDDEYAEVVSIVAAHRDTVAKRIAVMALFPDEEDWLLEAAAEYVKGREDGYVGDEVVWRSLTSLEQIAAVGIADVEHPWVSYRTLIPLVATFGADTLPILTGPIFADCKGSYLGNLVLKAISTMPSDEATAHLLERLEEPGTQVAAVEAADRFPLRTLRVAARLAPTFTADQRARLVAVAALPDPALRVHLSETERAALDELFASTGHVPEAAPEELPPLLVTPPWARKGRKARRVVIEELEAPASQLLWSGDEREAWSEALDPDDDGVDYWSATGEEKGLDAFSYRLTAYLAEGNVEKAKSYLDKWKGDEYCGGEHELQRILARFGEGVIDRVLLMPAKNHRFTKLPGPVLSEGAARIAAARLARKASSRSAIRWFDRHGLAAVPYLVPDALGTEKQRRPYAESALHHLAGRHGAAAVAAEAEEHGPEAAEAITALLGDDPLAPRVKVPKPGAWVVPTALPQVLLNGGERSLPVDSVGHLITVLALATPEHPYIGIEVVAEACDRDSLSRFSFALFESWLKSDAPSKDRWALTQLAHFADDAITSRLAELVREWPNNNQHKRAVTGLEVLAAIGTEDALRALQQVADKVKFKALKAEASRQITAIAKRLGLSREQLADRLVPDFGLGEQDALVLDYGPRQFTVVLDERLNPSVTDQTGKSFKTLPKPGAKDDGEVAQAAYARFAALRKGLRTVATDQVRRLEAAMIEARTWTKDEFERYFIEHALNRHLARRLVWSAEIDGAHTGFRIAEDLSYTDSEDGAFALPDDVPIRLDHPVLMGERVNDWIELFRDYEILQPFDQFSRPAMALTAEERETGNLTRFEGTEVEILRLLGLISQGWDRAKPEDGGVEPGITHTLANGLVVTVGLEPGIWAGAAKESPEQTIRSVIISKGKPCWWFDERNPMRLGDIDPVTASEILARLTRLSA